MDKNRIVTEVIRQTWDDNHGVCFQVGPDSDGLDCVRICTPDAKSIEYYGKIDFSIQPELALELSKSIALSAREIMAKKQIPQ